MDDFGFWFYIIAAVIYFLTRKKKKPGQPNPHQGSGDNRPQQTTPPKSFEDLLREITEGRQTPEPEEEPTYRQEPVVIKEAREDEDAIRLEGERRTFADEESKRVYEESIKEAEGADIEFAPNENYQRSSLFNRADAEEDEQSLADEIRDGLNSTEARKAVIYSEILNRKY